MNLIVSKRSRACHIFSARPQLYPCADVNAERSAKLPRPLLRSFEFSFFQWAFVAFYEEAFGGGYECAAR